MELFKTNVNNQSFIAYHKFTDKQEVVLIGNLCLLIVRIGN